MRHRSELPRGGLGLPSFSAPEDKKPQRRGRMTRLRERVLGWNIYRWAGEVLGTVLRLPDPEVIS